MADDNSPKREQAAPKEAGPPPQAKPIPPPSAEDDFLDWKEDESYSDPELARRRAAVRTELLRRSQPTWKPDE